MGKIRANSFQELEKISRPWQDLEKELKSGVCGDGIVLTGPSSTTMVVETNTGIMEVCAFSMDLEVSEEKICSRIPGVKYSLWAKLLSKEKRRKRNVEFISQRLQESGEKPHVFQCNLETSFVTVIDCRDIYSTI